MSSKRGIVVAGHAATADAGAAVLRAGGNAVDAALAAVCTSFCAEPVLTSAGGGGFMLIADGGKAKLYDGFARMPSGLSLSSGLPFFSSDSSPGLQAIPIDFGDSVQTFHIGSASVGTPSLLAMLFAAHRQHGNIPLRDALAPGIDAARSGVRLNHLQASFIKLLKPILTSDKHCAAIHAPNNTLLTEGDNFQNKDLANSLEMLSYEGIDEMYHGDLARHIVAACMPHGLLNMDDMRGEHVVIREPLSIPLFDGSLLSNPPPSSGGVLISLAASLLEQLMLSGKSANNKPWPVLMAEVLRIASRIRHDESSQPGLDKRIHEQGIAADILAPERIKQHLNHIAQQFDQIAQSIGPDSALHRQARAEPSNRHGSTTHISIIDKDGMAVSLTSSNGEGSGIVVPGTGIHLNNMLGEEDINPLGLHSLPAGLTLPSMMAPCIYMKHGKAAVILGSGGSNRLRGAILQVLTRHLLLGQDIDTAVHAPRLHNEANRLDIEPGFLSEHDQAQCMQMGWELNQWQKQSVYFGGVHAISRDANGGLSGCGDPRRGGAVAYA
ncbi:MAG: gamma-glutamyltransferase [Mariprofundus sp.]|nr:gamma-glutamyltransferase [Mariprofundus sp.]